MKAIFFLVAAIAVAGAGEDKPAKKIAKGGKEMTVEVLSANPDAKTITIRKVTDVMDEGTPAARTLTVDEKVTASLKDIKAGDKVTLTCQAEAPKPSEQPASSDQPAEADANCNVTAIEKLPSK